METTIILSILCLFILIGLARNTLKDFSMNAATAIILLLIVIGTNFIAPISIGYLTFSIGTIILYGFCLSLFIIRGKGATKLTAFGIMLLLGGILYASTRIAALLGSSFFSEINYVYAILIGLLAFLFTKNGKYSFITATFSVALVGIILQLGRTVNLNSYFLDAVVVGTTAVVLHGLTSKLGQKPSKVSYYYEIGRLKD